MFADTVRQRGYVRVQPRCAKEGVVSAAAQAVEPPCTCAKRRCVIARVASARPRDAPCRCCRGRCAGCENALARQCGNAEHRDFESRTSPALLSMLMSAIDAHARPRPAQNAQRAKDCWLCCFDTLTTRLWFGSANEMPPFCSSLKRHIGVTIAYSGSRLILF